MIVAESTRTRRLVGRLDRGADLLEQLAEVCRAHGVRAGEIRAVGALEEVVVGEWDQRARALKPPRRFAAPFEIVTLSGTVGDREGRPSVQAWVSLSRERDNGVELLGGRLVAGRVFACEFVLDAFDDLRLGRALDPSTGLTLWEPSAAPPADAAAASTPAPTFDAPARTSWTEVMAASERRDEAAREPQPLRIQEAPPVYDAPAVEVQVRAGDVIEHPKFGRVQVERVDGDQEFVTARLRNQRLIRLSLDVLTLIHAGQEEGHNLFRAVAGK